MMDKLETWIRSRFNIMTEIKDSRKWIENRIEIEQIDFNTEEQAYKAELLGYNILLKKDPSNHRLLAGPPSSVRVDVERKKIEELEELLKMDDLEKWIRSNYKVFADIKDPQAWIQTKINILTKDLANADFEYNNPQEFDPFAKNGRGNGDLKTLLEGRGWTLEQYKNNLSAEIEGLKSHVNG
jgi:hypothetical protein